MIFAMSNAFTSINTGNNYFKIGVGLTLFVSGGLASYAFLQHQASYKKLSSQKNEQELQGEINNLKIEIVVFKDTLLEAVSFLRRELNNIKRDVNLRRKKRLTTKSSQSSHVIGVINNLLQDGSSDDEFKHCCDNLQIQSQPPYVGKGGENISLDEICSLCDFLNEGSDENKENAFKILQENEIIHQESWELLWRLSRSHISAYSESEDYHERWLHATAALKHIKHALNIKEDSSLVHKWFAISLGATTDFVGTKEKISLAFQLNDHIDRALHLDPHDATLHFMKGRWCWGVYMLTWVERKLASTLFISPPTASVQDALDAFLRAEDIQPEFYKANQYYIAKCYYEVREYAVAKRWLDSANLLPCCSKDDNETQAEIEAMLAKF